MANIWEFAEDLPFVEVKTVSGDTFRGEIIHISDADEADADEDMMSVEAKTGEIRIFQASEIKSVRRLVDKT